MNEVELLFTQIINCNRLSLYLNKDFKLDRDKSHLISMVLKKRISGEPLPYILGKTEFMGWEFEVTPDVFIPRAETEVLVEAALKIVGKLECLNVKVLDLGTGSGCIAISLAKNLTSFKIDAIDISREALKIARENAKLNNVDINFIQSDLFDNFNLQPHTYDLIISNPPYVATTDIPGLELEVRYEPRMAIDGGKDGLDFYRRIIRASPDFLKKDSFLILEMGFNQFKSIKEIFGAAKRFEILEVVKDYNNIDRVIIAQHI